MGVVFASAEGADFGDFVGGSVDAETDGTEGGDVEWYDACSVDAHDSVFLLVAPFGRFVENRLGHIGPFAQVPRADIVEFHYLVVVGHLFWETECVEVAGDVKPEAHAAVAVGIVGPHEVVVVSDGQAQNAEVAVGVLYGGGNPLAA